MVNRTSDISCIDSYRPRLGVSQSLQVRIIQFYNCEMLHILFVKWLRIQANELIA